MPKKTGKWSFKNTLLQIAELLKKLKNLEVFSFIGIFDAVFLGWVLTKARPNFFSAFILTSIFILGTVVIALIIKVVTLGISEFITSVLSQNIRRRR
jgi:hypothetical protein